MAISTSLLHGRKYPFIFTISILILAVTLLLISNSQYSTFFSFSSSPTPFSLLRQFSVSPSLSHPPPPPPPEIPDPSIITPPSPEIPDSLPLVSPSPEIPETSTTHLKNSESKIIPPLPEIPESSTLVPPLPDIPDTSIIPQKNPESKIISPLSEILESSIIPRKNPGSNIISPLSEIPELKLVPPLPDIPESKLVPPLPDILETTISPQKNPESEIIPSSPEIAESSIIPPTTELLIVPGEIGMDENLTNLSWNVCKGPTAVDYIPCLDNFEAIKRLKKGMKKHMAHRERHCPEPRSRCLVPLPRGYKLPISWPKSRDMIWYDNVPHPKLVDYKKDQRWVIKSGDNFVFPGGGTQFREGASSYIKFIEEAVPAIKLGQNIRVVLDVGCGVASFGGNLMDRDVITMSFAPKDEHEAQIQFALERGIPAILSVIGTQQLTFPNNVYDLIHCARCRVPWHEDGGIALLELNRVLRPGGFFVWSATPVYVKDERHVSIWNSMVALTESMCWREVTKVMASTGVGLVVYQKPVSSSCYQERKKNEPPTCRTMGRNASWYTPLQRCISKLPPGASAWPPHWPERLTAKPFRLPSTPWVEELFKEDTETWSTRVSDVYFSGIGVNWTNVRNVMDMTARQGGFAAALINMPVWVMNVVPIHQPDTLPTIFDRGLIGVYHDWCESFNTYPRTYDLLHSTFLFSNLPNRCNIIDLAAEMDRITRPGGYIVVIESKDMMNKLASLFRSLHWSVDLFNDRYLVGQKSLWRPEGGVVQR